MIEEIKIDGVLYKKIEDKYKNCSKCDLGQFCDKNLGFITTCCNENIGYIFKKQ